MKNSQLVISRFCSWDRLTFRVCISFAFDPRQFNTFRLVVNKSEFVYYTSLLLTRWTNTRTAPITIFFHTNYFPKNFTIKKQINLENNPQLDSKQLTLSTLTLDECCQGMY